MLGHARKAGGFDGGGVVAGSSGFRGLFVAENGRNRFRQNRLSLGRQMTGIAKRAANESNAMRVDQQVAQSDVQ